MIMKGTAYMKPMILFLTIALAGFTACGLLNGGDGSGPRTIVFSAQDGGGTYQIYTMREDGSGVRRLTHGRYSSTAPDWSPDGERIAYARYTPDIGGDALWVMDADGSNQEPLVHNPHTGNPQRGSYPNWHPDGTRVAFEQCLNCEAGGDNYEIFVADLQSGTIDTLSNHPVADRQPKWSPDGQHIAFISNRNYYDADSMRWREDLYLIDKDSYKLQRLTEVGFLGSYAWVNFNEFLYIQYDANSMNKDLFLKDIDTEEVELILNLKANQFWIFWDQNMQQVISFEKEYQKTPLTMQFFDLEGNLLHEKSLNNSILKSAINLGWKERR